MRQNNINNPFARIKRDRAKRARTMAFAYVGVLTGAGLASGQELVQYFIGFGIPGLIAVGIVGILHWLFGGMMLALGSYFLATEHREVLDRITHPIIVKILDIGLVITCFVLGFVMIAGAGSNLNQQFGMPTWMGALLCALLIIGVSQFNFQKVSQIIGAFTPLIVGFILLGGIASLLKGDLQFEAATQIALRQPRAVPNLLLSSVNYFAMCLITGSSMAFVLGGEEFNAQVAKKSGSLGGAITGFITAFAAFTVYINMPSVEGADLPMQLVITNIHPILGVLMAIVIYGMIFNTGISMYYALARRIGGDDKRKFNMALLALVAVGFALSFAGFETLVGIMYPIIGYIGIVLILAVAYWWIRKHRHVKKEGVIRRRLFNLTFAKKNQDLPFTKQDQQELKQLTEASVHQNHVISDVVDEFVDEKIEAFKDVDTPE